jgi:alpha-beta hydrolase superfamily lysophospholipase
VRLLSRPLLIVHAVDDESVNVKEGRRLYEWANHEHTDYLEVPATGHTFGVGHPYRGASREFELVLRETISYFDANLH